MIKKTMLIVTALAITTTALTANSEKKVFDSGIRSALKVLKYEQESSLTHTDSAVKNKYCVSLLGDNGQVIKPFDVVKMESLSLYLKYEPAYLQYAENGESKNIFCFASGDTKKEAQAYLKAIRARYEKIDNFNPLVVQLNADSKYKRAIPYLGIWSKDMSETISVLNAKIEKQKLEIAEQKKENAKIKRNLKTISDTILSTSNKVSNTILSISDGKEDSEDFKADNSKYSMKSKAVESKHVLADEEIVVPKKEVNIATPKKAGNGLPDTVSKVKNSDRVFTVNKG